MNLTEKPEVKKDEPWIRDIQAADLAVNFKDPDQVAALCEGEPYHCEHCGEKFPLWPITEFANHFVKSHADALTLQQHQGILALCTAGLTDSAKQFLGIQIISRVSIRRRARDLGLIIFLDKQGRPIDKPKPRIIQ
jgi:hypothetical protein